MRNKLWIWISGILVLILGAVGLFAALVVAPTAYIGTGYVAHRLCSCVFVSGRPVDSCTVDLGPDAASIPFTIDRSAQTVTSSIPVLATSTATYHGPTGCRL